MPAPSCPSFSKPCSLKYLITLASERTVGAGATVRWRQVGHAGRDGGAGRDIGRVGQQGKCQQHEQGEHTGGIQHGASPSMSRRLGGQIVCAQFRLSSMSLRCRHFGRHIGDRVASMRVRPSRTQLARPAAQSGGLRRSWPDGADRWRRACRRDRRRTHCAVVHGTLCNAGVGASLTPNRLQRHFQSPQCALVLRCCFPNKRIARHPSSIALRQRCPRSIQVAIRRAFRAHARILRW